jgi:beta-glucosidase
MNEIWYGGGDTHRTPFGGRTPQYYSEDGNFGYIVGTYEAEAMQENGIIYCIKHFAMNEQETSRESTATFATEQSIREEYLRAFEGAFAKGGALSTMTAFNRIGVIYCAVNENLLTNVLRGEWGFEGHITTDGFSASSLYKTHYLEMYTAGLDFFCLDSGYNASAIEEAINAGDGNMMRMLRDMAKHNIYAAVHSVSVNGLSSNSVVVTVVPFWQTAMLVATAVFALVFVICVLLCIITMFSGKKSKR